MTTQARIANLAKLLYWASMKGAMLMSHTTTPAMRMRKMREKKLMGFLSCSCVVLVESRKRCDDRRRPPVLQLKSDVTEHGDRDNAPCPIVRGERGPEPRQDEERRRLAEDDEPLRLIPQHGRRRGRRRRRYGCARGWG